MSVWTALGPTDARRLVTPPSPARPQPGGASPCAAVTADQFTPSAPSGFLMTPSLRAAQPLAVPLPTVPPPPAPLPVAPPPAPTGAAVALLAGQRPAPLTDLGPGFPAAAPDPTSVAVRMHDWMAARVPSLFGLAADQSLHIVSDVTSRFLGVDVEALLTVEQTMYRMMVPSRDGYVGGSPPIFQALANGQAAYVYIKGRDDDAQHITRLFTGLPPRVLRQLGPGTDELAPVRQALLDRMQRGDFPGYVSVDGRIGGLLDGTDSIATESIASIARRQNALSVDFPDPTSYYRWLVTRVDSAFRRVDPWLDRVKPELHREIAGIKEGLTPPWVSHPTKDPLGHVPDHRESQQAYRSVMAILGNGEKPTYDTLSDFADTAISLDRDLLFAVQTYWIKLFREISPAQRESLFDPIVRTWVSLNVLSPDDPSFPKVSPDTAPYIELVDKRSDDDVMERYDRAIAMREVLDHTLDGLGVEARRKLLSVAIDGVRARQADIEAREERLRQALGPGYPGLDIDGLLHDRVDLGDPGVQAGLEALRHTLGAANAQARPMTALHAEILRHVTLLDWVARRRARYDEPAAALADRMGVKSGEPLVLGEYYRAEADRPSPLPPGPSTVEVLGKPRPGAQPLRTSILLEGGGGLGFAYVECLRQLKDGLSAGSGLVAIDEYVGTSAGAISAGLLAAGYGAAEMGRVLEQLDFKRFYADYLWLGGGTDPQVRGIDRNGLFTTRQMYQTMRDLLAAKVNVHGRPVLFRDLPFKLKVNATVLNTDLPEDLRRQLGIAPDGQIVFSSETTPNMDVAAAICGSAAVPTFFQAPQVTVARPEPDGQGGTRMATYRLQLADGGTVNNFPATEAAEVATRPSLLAVLPAYFQAPAGKPGDPPVSLSLLNFDKGALAQVDAYNRSRWSAMTPRLATFLQKSLDAGIERAVIGFNPSALDDQTEPIVQGRTRADSERLRGLASDAGLSTMAAKKAARLVRALYPTKRSYAEQLLVEGLLDVDGVFEPSWRGRPQYVIPRREADGMSDVVLAVSAANVVASRNVEARLFEKP